VIEDEVLLDAQVMAIGKEIVPHLANSWMIAQTPERLSDRLFVSRLVDCSPISSRIEADVLIVAVSFGQKTERRLTGRHQGWAYPRAGIALRLGDPFSLDTPR
jgi:hypothetical protein